MLPTDDGQVAEDLEAGELQLVEVLYVGGTSTPPSRRRARSSVRRPSRLRLSAAVDTQLAMQDALERPSKFGVEDRVDDRIEETVDVAEPDEERKQPRVDVAQSRPHRPRDVISVSGLGRR